MEQLVHPLLLYLACLLGGLGIALALPRPRVRLALPGGLLAAAGGGLVVLLLSLRAYDTSPEALPNVFFYAFAAIALAAGLRVITHHRPVYSALYFILTIIATAGLFLLLSAEFMAFALIIIYAGAILITYLFVIMLATQAPAEGDEELQAEYDTTAREPWLAAGAGFVLLGILTTMLFRGVGELPPPALEPDAEILAQLPGKVETILTNSDLRGPDELLADGETLKRVTDPETGESAGRLVVTASAAGDAQVIAVDADGNERTLTLDDEFDPTNVERLGINLLRDHPMTIEIAGVILLMAMLGATVLARKQVEFEEALKAHEQRRLHDSSAEKSGASEA
ncbi:MAG: NADH-quinone oxidoreductase subunit J [Phycisphaerales bacterium JB040]